MAAPSRSTSPIRVGLLGALVLILTSEVSAQFTVRASTDTVYVGVPFRLTVEYTATDDNEPKFSIVGVDGGRVRTGRAQSTNRVTSIRNGVRRTRIIWQQEYEVTANAVDELRIGPFVVEHGERRLEDPAKVFPVLRPEQADSMRIRAVLPERPLYVGEFVDLELVWTADHAKHADELGNGRFELDFPLARSERFRCDPVPVPEDVQASALPVGAEERGQFAVREVSQNGRRQIEVRARWRLVPLEIGQHEIEPARAVVTEVTRWARRRSGFFDRRVPAETRPLVASDLPRTIEVIALPSGAPPSHAGAIGRGFQIEVEADRSVVQVGDPIELTIRLRGDGALDVASLPALSLSGLDASTFQVPDTRRVGGTITNGVKSFQVTIRPKTASASEIPAIEYSWFDPEARRYETAASDPIALRVGDADTVGADAIVGAPTKSEATPDVERERPFDSTGTASLLAKADLGQRAHDETDTNSARGTLPWIPVIYAGSVALLGLGAFFRWRSQIDPETLRTKKRLAALDSDLGSARSTANVERATTAAREIAAIIGGDSELDDAIADAEQIQFAPGGGSESERDRVTAAVAAAARAAIGRHS